MPTYSYRARDVFGKLVKGTLEAQNVEEAKNWLRKKQLFIIELQEINQQIFKWKREYGRKLSVGELAFFCRQLSTLLDAGVPILNSLFLLKEQTKDKSLRHVLAQVAEELQKGNSLSQALGRHPNIFPPLMVNMVEAGEIGGVLDEVLFRLALHWEKEYVMEEKIRSALAYPLVVMVVAWLAVLIFLILVLPSFQGILANMEMEMPLVTGLVLNTSLFFQKYWYLGFFLFFLTTVGFKQYLNTDSGQELWSKIVLQIPVFGGVNQKIIISRFSRTLGTLLKGGVPILQALEVSKRIADNKVVEKALTAVMAHVKDGGGVATPLAKCKVFPPMVVQMMAIGEEAGALEEMLEKISQYYDEEVESTISRLSSILEPLLILFLGGIVGFLILAIMLPMFKIIGSI